MAQDKEKGSKAVALKYSHGRDRAPMVVAKGRGLVAERIISIAKANQVPCVEDPQLVEALASLDLDVEIPADLYLAVAKVLAFVYRLEKNHDTDRV